MADASADQESANGVRSDTSQAAGGSSARVAAHTNSRAPKRTAAATASVQGKSTACRLAGGQRRAWQSAGRADLLDAPSAARPAVAAARGAPRTQRHCSSGAVPEGASAETASRMGQVASRLGPVPDPSSRPPDGQSLGATAQPAASSRLETKRPQWNTFPS